MFNPTAIVRHWAAVHRPVAVRPASAQELPLAATAVHQRRGSRNLAIRARDHRPAVPTAAAPRRPGSGRAALRPDQEAPARRPHRSDARRNQPRHPGPMTRSKSLKATAARAGWEACSGAAATRRTTRRARLRHRANPAHHQAEKATRARVAACSAGSDAAGKARRTRAHRPPPIRWHRARASPMVHRSPVRRVAVRQAA